MTEPREWACSIYIIFSTCSTHSWNPLDRTTLQRRQAKPPDFSSINCKTDGNRCKRCYTTHEVDIFLESTLQLFFSCTFEQMKLKSDNIKGLFSRVIPNLLCQIIHRESNRRLKYWSAAWYGQNCLLLFSNLLSCTKSHPQQYSNHIISVPRLSTSVLCGVAHYSIFLY